MSIEIQLISEIEKHQCLYDFNLPEYNRKEVLDEAWTEVATNCNLTVHECKDKWKNIRSSFLRSLKQSTGKPKKPYYMTTYLQFIVPFLKPAANIMVNADDSQIEDQDSNDNTSESDLTLATIKIEPLNEVEVDQMEYQSVNMLSTTEAERPVRLPKRPSILRRKCRQIPSSLKSYSEFFRHKNQKTTALATTTARVENNALRYFLLSLLPEFDTMTDDQIRLFKIKVMMLIDDIKANYPDVKQSLSSNNDRLQKRLINLLLSNLERSGDNSRDKQ